MDAILDTTVVLHLFRKYKPAVEWFRNPQRYAITSITWMEVMEGATNKANQAESKNILSQFELLYLTSSDQKWAMTQIEKFQFSHHIGRGDCMIASVAYHLQVPLYTHNLKDMMPLIGTLAVKPYS
ncbi:MAG: PIN domain-containing protein [Aggregatilineales bacterium]